MKNLFYIIIISLLYNFGKAQTANELIAIHQFNNMAAINSITNPIEGSLAYNLGDGFLYYFDDTNWIQTPNTSSGSAGWNLEGNTGITANTQFLGTTDNNDLNIRTNNLNRVRVDASGNLNILNDLIVDGAAYNNTAYDAGASTTIDFELSNLAYTNASAQNTFTLQNIKDGGTYSLSVRGNNGGTIANQTEVFWVNILSWSLQK